MHAELTSSPAPAAERVAHPAIAPVSEARPGRAQVATRVAPRVLMIVESAAGGTGRHVLDLCRGLLGHGCEVHLLHSTRRIDGFFEKGLASLPDLRRWSLPLHTSIHPRDFSHVRAVRRYVRKFGPFDIIHGHSSKGGAIARLAAIGNGAAAFYTLHGLIMMDPGLARWKWLTYLGIELTLSRRTARIIAVSPEEQRAAARLGFGQSRVILIPNGLDPQQSSLASREAARATIGLNANDDSCVIGFVGRLVDQKAPHVLIEAFATALKKTARARLAMVGAGPLEQELHDLARRLGVQDQIHWLGERDARTVFAGFDLLAMPSRKEGLPYVVIEAMDAGLPIIATSSAGVECLVAPDVNGLVVPPDDAASMAAALTTLLSDPLRRAEFGRASRQRAADFTVDKMVQRTLDAYREHIA
jgi:glycosyltransferase involved in cell wall biosynthesis